MGMIKKLYQSMAKPSAKSVSVGSGMAGKAKAALGSRRRDVDAVVDAAALGQGYTKPARAMSGKYERDTTAPSRWGGSER